MVWPRSWRVESKRDEGPEVAKGSKRGEGKGCCTGQSPSNGHEANRLEVVSPVL
jgi:hypothetical protein